MQDFEICWETALAIGRRIRAGEFSAAEVARVFLEAIDQFNGPINAVVTIDAEGAIRAADAVDRKLHAGELRDSPLAGVPFLAKDLDITAGVRTTFGSVLHEDYVPRWDMFHIARLKAAGCVLLGKTNTPEHGVIPNSRNLVFGATRNPWNLERCAGGSSGGSGAAVAAGLSPLATGSDGAGSIRIPASMNGCFGIKPTFGMIPFGPKGIGPANSVGHLGPMTRGVADAAAMLDVMAGGSERDRGSIPKPANFLAALKEEFKPTRVAFTADLGYARVDPDIRELFFAAIHQLRSAGWPLDEAKPRFEDPFDAINTVLAFEWGSIPFLLGKQDPKSYAKQTDELRQMGEARAEVTIDDLWRADSARKNVCVAMGEFFEKYDLLLTPALTRPAFEVELAWPRRRDDVTADDHGLNSMVYPFNLTGDPACSIPMGLTKEGLPAGLQIVGPRHRDEVVFQAAAAYEEVSGQSGRRPPHGVSRKTLAAKAWTTRCDFFGED